MPQGSSRSPPLSRAGVTLIELLLSLAIAVLLLALLYSVYHAVARTAESQEHRRLTDDPVTRAREWLTEDLRNLFLPSDDPHCRLELRAQEDHAEVMDELSLCRSVLVPPGDGLRWSEVYRVVHRVVRSPNGGRAWIREQHPLPGQYAEQGPTTNVLLSGITRFKGFVYDGHTWQSAWPGPDDDARPRALRLELATEEADDLPPVEVSLPVGHYTAEPPAGHEASTSAPPTAP